MWEELLDPWRTQALIVYFVVIFPVSLALVPDKSVVHEFKIYRLQQFDLVGTTHGSRLSRVSFEATTLGSANLLRRCLVVWWKDLVGRDLSDLLHTNLGALLIILPEKLKEEGEKSLNAWYELEHDLLMGSWNLPIHVAYRTAQLQNMIESLQSSHNQQKQSALSALVDSVTANVFQLVSTRQTTTIKTETTLYNVVGHLKSSRAGELSTIVIVAHYDAGGIAPSLAFGADSNGSGVSALLELARIFGHLYESGKTRAKYNLVFLLSAGGKLNYEGVRQWIEEQSDPTGEHSKIDLAVCLDSLSGGSSLNMHVSKLPREGSTHDLFLRRLKAATSARFGTARDVAIVSKKINLGDEFLSWEHERFNIGRIAGLTLSKYSSAKNHSRASIMDTIDDMDYDSLMSNVEVIGEALVRQVYDLPDQNTAPEPVLLNQLAVRKDMMQAYLNMLTGYPRGTQLFLSGVKNPILYDLHRHMELHTDNAVLAPVTADKKDPEFGVYAECEDTMRAYQVKPAIFDLLLALAIAAYLATVYYFVLNIHAIRAMLQGYCQSFIKTKSY